MSRTSRINRTPTLAKPAGVSATAENAIDDITPQEADLLVSEMAESYRSFVEYYRKTYKVDAAEAVAKKDELLTPRNEEYENSIRYGPVEHSSWYELEHLMANDPPAFRERWAHIKRTAIDELESGWRAARVVEGYHNDPWDRARFIALRHSLIEQWKPTNGIETSLIDTMAQAQTFYMQWMKTMSDWLSIEANEQHDKYDKDGCWQPPRVSVYQAMEQEAAMADRFNRLFLRTLRQLRDLRRYTPPVTIQSASQVNIDGQQINVSGSPARKTGE
jgi:hypothetical protein